MRSAEHAIHWPIRRQFVGAMLTQLFIPTGGHRRSRWDIGQCDRNSGSTLFLSLACWWGSNERNAKKKLRGVEQYRVQLYNPFNNNNN